MNLMVGTPILKELALAGAVEAATATRKGDGFLLTIQINGAWRTLEAQRGGPRLFKTLDSLSRYIEALEIKCFTVCMR